MKEAIILIIIIMVYLFFSYFFHKLSLRINQWYFVLLILAIYIFLTFYLFEFFNTFHNYLRVKGIYFEFGHANSSLVEVAFACLFISIANIIWIILKKLNSKK